MSNIIRTVDSAAILKTKIITDFSLATPIIAWSSEGSGKNFNLITRRPDQTFANTPVAGVTTVRQRYTLVPGIDVYNQYFISIPANQFLRATVSFAANTVFVNLNMEA
jgi:hypothetical protein